MPGLFRLGVTSRGSRRPRTHPSPEGPWVFRAVRLLVGVLGGLFALTVLASALGPQVYTDVAHSVDARLVLPEEAELPALRERSAVYAADGSRLALIHDEEQREVVDIADLPDHVWQAVITAEDRRFFEHEGYDVEGIGRAAVANLEARGIAQGGSTITQQLAKNNFLDDEQTLDRKFSELLYAMALERELDKEYLLDRYMNQVYFGGGAYGIQAAAEVFFGIDAAELEPHQSAMLAGIIRAPGLFDPRRDPDGALARRDRVLAGMAAEGYLEAEEGAELRELDSGVIDPRGDQTREPFVVEAVKREFLADPAFGETRQERQELLFSGGLELHTTIEPDLQDILREVVRDHYPEGAPTAAISSVEPATGRVVALGSGQEFTDSQYDLALQGRRQPGSAFKTFVMLEALRQGFPPDLLLDGESPLEFDLGTEVWEVGNYGGRSFGPIDLADATRQSVNTYYAQLATLVGVEEITTLTDELGIDRAAYGAWAGLAAVSIGGLDRGTTPLEMASAYGVLTHDGVRTSPFLLERITDVDGEEIWAHEMVEDRVLSPEVNAVGRDLLIEVVESGTGTAARLDGWEVAGKTGTTNDNYDAWFVGVTPALSTSVWVGHPGGNVAMPDATGGGMAAPLWRDFMQRALEGYEPSPFPSPDPEALLAVYEGEEIDVPSVVGLSEEEALWELAAARLVADPVTLDSAAPAGTVVRQSPRGDSTAAVGSTVEIFVSSGTPPPPPPEEEDDDEDDDAEDPEDPDVPDDPEETPEEPSEGANGGEDEGDGEVNGAGESDEVAEGD